MSPSHCRDCREPITWVTVTPSGKRMPIDQAFDAERGTLRRRFHRNEKGRWFSTVEVLTGAELAQARDLARRYPTEADHRLWTPHPATCPARHRKATS